MNSNKRSNHNDEYPARLMIADYFKKNDTYEVIRPQGMENWLITFTLSGEGFFVVDDRDKHITRAGDIVLLRPNTDHHYGTQKGKQWEFVWAHFSHLPETILLPEEDLIVHHLEQEHTQKRVLQAFQKIIEDSRERSGLWQDLCFNALSEVMLLLTQQNSRKQDPRVDQVLYLLSRRMKEDIRIAELATEVSLSTSRLSHLFKEATGSSIIDTLNRMRLQQAGLLLLHTNRNASEVSIDVGFQNYNHFAELFRKYYGVNPSAYKLYK